jgi:hypothetical protein
VETNSGVTLDQMVRTGACGTWWSGSTPAGFRLGLLQLDPGLLSAPVANERAAAAVAAVRAVNPEGVLRMTDLVTDRGQTWLVAAAAPALTVADLVEAGAGLEPGLAAGIAVDVGHALRDLHAAGLGHGALTLDTVTISVSGTANLVEVGMLAAVRDAPTDVGRDTGAWAGLARELARLTAADEAQALLAAATTAEQGDLATAVRRLTTATEALPGFADRDLLAARRPTAGPERPQAHGVVSTVDTFANGVRLRFGPGVPDRAAPPRGRRAGASGSLRAIQVAVLLVALLLGAGAAAWALALFG